MDTTKAAKVSGWSLILMAIVASFSLGYVYPIVYDSENTITSSSVVSQNFGLYVGMLIGIFFTLSLDFIVSYSLYIFFKKTQEKISLISAALRIIYTLIFGIGAVYLFKNISILKPSNEFINYNFHQFQWIWGIGLILFGFHLLLIGVLMKLHKKIPITLCILTLLAGVFYIVVHILKLTSLEVAFTNNLELILALPMAMGELGLAIWLIYKGGKVKE